MRKIFEPDFLKYEGVRRINIYLLKMVFLLMFLFLGMDAWSAIFSMRNEWNPAEAAAWCIWAAFAVLSIFGFLRPLIFIPLLLLEIVYKLIWLIIVAYPIWSTNSLVGSSAEKMTYAFLWVILPIIAIPWGYTIRKFLIGRPYDPTRRGKD